MKIALGSDHPGFRLKQEVAAMLSEMGHELDDMGSFSEDSVDYPDFARKVAEAVASGAADLGILVCGTGQGMAISANKVPGVRAAVVSDTFSARMSREHNDANVLCMGARVVGTGLARDIVQAFMGASFQGGRHERRVSKIADIDAKYRRDR